MIVIIVVNKTEIYVLFDETIGQALDRLQKEGAVKTGDTTQIITCPTTQIQRLDLVIQKIGG